MASIAHFVITEWSVNAISGLGTWAIEKRVSEGDLSDVEKAHMREAWKLAKARENRQAAKRVSAANPVRESRCPECGGVGGNHPDLACAFA